MKAVKGQMFIITMVFLVGLIFAVQNNLSQYSFLNLASSFQGDDFYLLRGIKDSFSSTLTSSPNCGQADKNLQQLKNFLETNIDEASVEVSYILDCSLWSSSPLTVTIHIKSIESDTLETTVFSR